MNIHDEKQIGPHRLFLGDCLKIVPDLKLDHRSVAIVSDPPYGMNWNTNSSRFSGGQEGHRTRQGGGRPDWGKIGGDDQPFDPSPWLIFNECILWGSNHFAGRLPVGSTLVWIKRLDSGFGSFLSDAEIAWRAGGHGVYCRRDLTMNGAAGTKFRDHPTQKPVGIMQWCLEKIKASIVLDPFMGSGTTGVACQKMGRVFIGIERERKYFDAACKRITEAVNQGDMFAPPPVSITQKEMFGDAPA